MDNALTRAGLSFDRSKGGMAHLSCCVAVVSSVVCMDNALNARISNYYYFQHAHFIPIVGVGKRGEY